MHLPVFQDTFIDTEQLYDCPSASEVTSGDIDIPNDNNNKKYTKKHSMDDTWVLCVHLSMLKFTLRQTQHG